MACDKSLVMGDILIDDAPVAQSSLLAPTWEHVLYGTLYNADIDSMRRLEDWANWRDVVY